MLTKKQTEVLKLMSEGWELGSSKGGSILQKGGLGEGGKVRLVSRKTFDYLTSNHLVGIKPGLTISSFPCIYILTEEGEEAVKGE